MLLRLVSMNLSFRHVQADQMCPTFFLIARPQE